jgi:hypothetical protein
VRSQQEDRFAELLRGLTREGFAVLRHVGTGNGAGPIDYVVVGPSGVFVIETRDWRGNVHQATKGRLMCNGQDRSSTIEQAIAEAGEIRRHLEPLGVRSVDAIVALADARVRHPMTFRRVRVTSARDALALIRNAPARLTREQVARVSSAILRLVRAPGPAPGSPMLLPAAPPPSPSEAPWARPGPGSSPARTS